MMKCCGNMRWWCLLVMVAVAVDGKGKKHRQKPSRALLDRLSSTTVSEIIVTSASSFDNGLLPAPLDVAAFSTISANATCGQDGTEEFCRDTPGKRGLVCDVCESATASASRRHPPSHAADSDPDTWWQSPTLATGEQYQHVTLVATLPAEMDLLHVIMKSGPSPRPLAWSLEVSSTKSGEDWHMVRAFGDKEHCRKFWALRPERRRRKARAAKRIVTREEKPSCSTQFTSPRPLENGEMHVSIGEGLSARRVRISFRAVHPAPSTRQYYTVRSLTLAARCICHRHADQCHVGRETAKCMCVHGTCGDHCQRCCTGAPWSAERPCPEERGCDCGERGECDVDDTGTVICVNCTGNRAGPLCDRCLKGFFSTQRDGPCQPCGCHPEGSDGSCEYNKKRRSVNCKCLPRIKGPLCDSCEEEGAVFPFCEAPTTPACKCDPRGIVDPSRLCDEVCECKSNVMGERCDTCAPGHFGLNADLREGCKRCYCSHLTDTCHALDQDDSQSVISMPLGDAWLVTDASGQETLEPSIDDFGYPYIISYEVEGWKEFFWLTNLLSGERLNSYGKTVKISMKWGIIRGDTGGNPTVSPDAVLVGYDGTKLYYGNNTYKQSGQMELVIPLVEGDWYTSFEGQWQPVTREELMDVLKDLKAFKLRARFHTDQDEVCLQSVEFHPTSALVEQCSCPAGYAGPHCAHCSWSHARLPRAPLAHPNFECVPCACNEHAGCNAVDGTCGPCQHNTTGPHCERCLPGHYGNPVQGPCKPCACPLFLPSNNFSPNCALASSEGDDFVCTQCPEGYTGDHCESCEEGYWGSPATAGGSCQRCQCGAAPCNPDSGLCLTCPEHVEGSACDQCQEGFWFGPEGASLGSPCIPCECGAGALASACDARTGTCACKQGWIGRACDLCDEGYGDPSEGCQPCKCGVASVSSSCDQVSGSCQCRDGAAPPHCENCLPEYHSVTDAGCQS